MDCSPPGSSVHGIFEARILEWGAISSSRRSSRHRDWTRVSWVSCIGRRVLYHQYHLGRHKSLISCIWVNICPMIKELLIHRQKYVKSYCEELIQWKQDFTDTSSYFLALRPFPIPTLYWKYPRPPDDRKHQPKRSLWKSGNFLQYHSYKNVVIYWILIKIFLTIGYE